METNLTPNQSEFLLYVSQSGDVKVDVLLQDETVWLTQKGMQELFEKAKSTISEHIKNVFEEGELNEEVVVRDFRTTSQHGAIKDKMQENTVKYYNLDVIISVGYRVKSQRGTQFWKVQNKNYKSDIDKKVMRITKEEKKRIIEHGKPLF
jgi:hypothetical protein